MWFISHLEENKHIIEINYFEQIIIYLKLTKCFDADVKNEKPFIIK